MKPTTIIVVAVIIAAIFFAAPFSAMSDEDPDEPKRAPIVTEQILSV